MFTINANKIINKGTQFFLNPFEKQKSKNDQNPICISRTDLF